MRPEIKAINCIFSNRWQNYVIIYPRTSPIDKDVGVRKTQVGRGYQAKWGMNRDERTWRRYTRDRDESMDSPLSRSADVGLLSSALGSPPPLQPSFMHQSSYPATPLSATNSPYPHAAALVTGARVAKRRRKHEPTSPQLITRKTSSLRHVTKQQYRVRHLWNEHWSGRGEREG